MVPCSKLKIFEIFTRHTHICPLLPDVESFLAPCFVLRWRIFVWSDWVRKLSKIWISRAITLHLRMPEQTSKKQSIPYLILRRSVCSKSEFGRWIVRKGHCRPRGFLTKKWHGKKNIEFFIKSTERFQAKRTPLGTPPGWILSIPLIKRGGKKI